MCINREHERYKVSSVVKNNNIIEINGKRYDVTTGEMVGEITGKKAEHATIQKKSAVKKKLPDMAAPAPLNATHTLKTTAVTTEPVKHPHPTKSTLPVTRRKPAMNLTVHAPQHSKTLMRGIVDKPNSVFRSRLHAQSSTDGLVSQPNLIVTPKPSVDNIVSKRLKHARIIPKSSLISHYNIIEPKQGLAPRPKMVSLTAPTAARSYQHVPVRSLTTSEMLLQAIDRAHSHEQLPYSFDHSIRNARRRHVRRLIGIGGASLLVFAIIGLVIKINVSNIKLQFASSKAGFSAVLPTAIPSGYHLESLSSSTGIVALYFLGSNKGYTVSEQPSTWDSATLRDSFVSNVSPHYQTVDAAGETIFLYGKHDATWVSQGVWYQIRSDGTLSDEQLVSVATSL